MQDSVKKCWVFTVICGLLARDSVRGQSGTLAHFIQQGNRFGVFAELDLGFGEQQHDVCISDKDPVVAAESFSAGGGTVVTELGDKPVIDGRVRGELD